MWKERKAERKNEQNNERKGRNEIWRRTNAEKRKRRRNGGSRSWQDRTKERKKEWKEIMDERTKYRITRRKMNEGNIYIYIEREEGKTKKMKDQSKDVKNKRKSEKTNCS